MDEVVRMLWRRHYGPIHGVDEEYGNRVSRAYWTLVLCCRLRPVKSFSASGPLELLTLSSVVQTAVQFRPHRARQPGDFSISGPIHRSDSVGSSRITWCMIFPQ